MKTVPDTMVLLSIHRSRMYVNYWQLPSTGRQYREICAEPGDEYTNSPKVP